MKCKRRGAYGKKGKNKQRKIEYDNLIRRHKIRLETEELVKGEEK